jgi:NAD(P)-dependent dehydrogenase (short-subunit alcohol dehydrogenase family)
MEARMFEGYVVLITGAASGIGYSASQLFIEERATVIGADLDQAALDRARAAIGERFVPKACDVASEAQVAATAQFVEQEFGKLDVLINNAGRGMLVNLEAMQEADFYWHYDALVKGPMLMVKHFVPLLRKSSQPSIVNVSSQAARIEISRNHFLYSTAKAALLKFSRHLARDLPGIRANTVLPGWIDTPIYSRAGLDETMIKTIYDHALPRIPAKRIGKPEDIAHCILFLSSEKASYINGAAIDIDGGWGCNADWGGEPVWG